jgi:hypothetical protein
MIELHGLKKTLSESSPAAAILRMAPDYVPEEYYLFLLFYLSLSLLCFSNVCSLSLSLSLASA